MTKIDKYFGNNIKKFRKAKKLSQEQLAEMVDIARNTLSKIENGKCFVSSETLEKISLALGIDSYELFLFDTIDMLDFPYYKKLIENLKLDKIKTNPKLIKILYDITNEFINK